jgi:hypothetical protein
VARGFNINTFKQQGLALGGARPANFLIRIPTPPIGIGGSATQELEFHVYAASIPGGQIGVVQAPYFGRRIKLSGDRNFDEWTISILNDEDFALRAMFEHWQNKINALISNRMDSSVFPLGYKVDAEVLQFSKAGPGGESGVIRSYEMQGCWPSVVDPIPLDWGQQNTIETFNVTLAYDLWVPRIEGDGESYNPILNPA